MGSTSGTSSAALPHGTLDEVFTDVFFVTGMHVANYEGREWRFSRNMTVVREHGRLTLVNALRLDDEGLRALDQLGTVSNVVRIGSFHGVDDAFYVERHGAKLWALPGMVHESGLPTDTLLVPGGPVPCQDASLFTFETAAVPEALIHLDRDGGILISCDSLQNYDGPDSFFDDESAELMRRRGFFIEANVGPGWRRRANPSAGDFVRLQALRFRHLLSAHGVPLRDTAHEALAGRFHALFGI